MAAKIILLVALIACVSAGGPAAYSISAPSIDHAYVGSSQEHTVKGPYGQNSHSQYSKAVDSAHSSVRVSSSRISNDVLGYGGHYGAAHIAAPAIAHAYAAPAVKIAAPAIAAAYAPAHHYGTHLAAPAYAHSYAAPAFSHGYAAPAFAHGYAAPAFAHGYAAPAIAHGYAAPAIKYAAPAIKYAAPAVSYAHSYASPLAYGHGLPAHFAAPHYAGHYGAPLAVKTAVAAPAVVHTSFAGHGAHFAY